MRIERASLRALLAAVVVFTAAVSLTSTEPIAATAGESAVVYYVNRNAQKSGDHEVHTTACRHGAKEENRLYLGSFDSCEDAVRAAKKHYPQSDGCYHCARACDHG